MPGAYHDALLDELENLIAKMQSGTMSKAAYDTAFEQAKYLKNQLTGLFQQAANVISPAPACKGDSTLK